MMLKVAEFAAEVDVRDAGIEMEMMDTSPVLLPAAAAAVPAPPLIEDAVILSDSDSDADGAAVSEYSLASSDSEQPRDADDAAVSEYSLASSDSEQPRDEENLNANDDGRGSSVDIYESRTPSPPAADAVPLPVEEQTAAVAGDGESVAVATETTNRNEPVSVPAAAHAQRVVDLDDSVSCFKTTKRKKPVVISPPVSRDDETDEAEVSVLRLKSLFV